MNAELVAKHRFKLLSPSEVMKLPDPTFIIDGVLPENGMAQLFGKSGSYKSFVSLDMTLSIATGTPWLGNRKTKKSKVVYVGAEGAPGYKKRIAAWLKDNKLKLRDIEDNFRFLQEPMLLNDNLDCDVFLYKVKQFVAKDEIDLIVFDTQARCTGGWDENDGVDMGLMITKLDEFKRELDTSVLLVHHTGLKELTRGRGHSSVHGALDAQFSVTKTKNKMVVTLKCEKLKDWEDGWEEDLLLIPVADSLVLSKGDKIALDTIDFAWTALSPKRRKVLTVLQKAYMNGSPNGISYSDWLDQSEAIMSKAGFIKALNTFKEHQLVSVIDEKYVPVAGLPA